MLFLFFGSYLLKTNLSINNHVIVLSDTYCGSENAIELFAKDLPELDLSFILHLAFFKP